MYRMKKPVTAMSLAFSVWIAGGTGFEPAIPLAEDNRLAGGPNRPLWHPPVGTTDY